MLTPKECPTTRWIGQGWLIRIHLPEHLPSPSPFVLNSTPEFSSCQDVLSISLQFLPGQSMSLSPFTLLKDRPFQEPRVTQTQCV